MTAEELLKMSAEELRVRCAALQAALEEKCCDVGLLLGTAPNANWEEWKRLADKCESIPEILKPKDSPSSCQWCHAPIPLVGSAYCETCRAEFEKEEV